MIIRDTWLFFRRRGHIFLSRVECGLWTNIFCARCSLAIPCAGLFPSSVLLTLCKSVQPFRAEQKSGRNSLCWWATSQHIGQWKRELLDSTYTLFSIEPLTSPKTPYSPSPAGSVWSEVKGCHLMGNVHNTVFIGFYQIISSCPSPCTCKHILYKALEEWEWYFIQISHGMVSDTLSVTRCCNPVRKFSN